MKISSIRISRTAEPQSSAKADQHSTINYPSAVAVVEAGPASSLLNHPPQAGCVPSTSICPLTRSRPSAMPAAPKSRRRWVKPIAFLAFHDEFVGLTNVSGVRRIASGLCDDVDKEVPSAGLT
jgi:hypothetical protein